MEEARPIARRAAPAMLRADAEKRNRILSSKLNLSLTRRPRRGDGMIAQTGSADQQYAREPFFCRRIIR